jgi:hypothetical protein
MLRPKDKQASLLLLFFGFFRLFLLDGKEAMWTIDHLDTRSNSPFCLAGGPFRTT